MYSKTNNSGVKIIIKSLFILIFGFSLFNEVNSVYNYIEINDSKAYFLKYEEITDDYVEKIKNGSISFSLKGNEKDTEFYCGEIGCFFINSSNENIKDKGYLLIKLEGKNIEIPYIITFVKKQKEEYKSNKKGIDISEKMLYKTIQKRNLSCEISATANILSNLKGKNIDEDTLLKVLPKSKYNTLPILKNGQKYWGNPNKGFVGYIDKLPDGTKARQRKMTGYGVLEKPIEKIINDYGFKTNVITKFDYKPNFSKKEHLTLILEELEKGNMIQLWGDICTNPKFYNGKEKGCTYDGKSTWNDDRRISWYYKDKNGKEKKYVGLNGEHAYYLLGYKGKINEPTDIIVWDTYTGRHVYKTEEWMRKWEKMQYRSIIIYK